MKILKIEFCNLNSLKGHWSIDFEHPDYLSESIFAITGPTGSGKSTILDAISLALYGQTPRLGLITKNNNEIMTRHCAECSSELTFETVHGRYRCSWSQRRAFGKVSGNLLAQKHEIVNAENGEILAAKIRDVAAKVEEVSGMDFQRFTRSILLAQGDFAAFLQANEDERAPILEQITGTEIYREISIAVHERSRDEKNLLDKLKAELENIKTLDDDEENVLKTNLTNKSQTLQEMQKELKKNEMILAWQKGIIKLKQDLLELEKQQQEQELAEKEFKPKLEKLERGNRASRLESEYKLLLQRRKDLSNEKIALDKLENELVNDRQKLDKMQEIGKTLADKLLTAEEELEKQEPIIQEVIQLDARLAFIKEDLDKSAKVHKKNTEELRKLENEISELQTNEKKTEKLLQKQRIWLEDHKCDAALVDELAGHQVKIESLSQKQQELEEFLIREEKAKKAYQIVEKNTQQKLQQYEKNQKEFSVAEEAQKQALEQFNQLSALGTENDLRVKMHELRSKANFFDVVASLEEHRKKLHKDKECPLCGSKEHPFLGVDPLQESDDFTEKIEALEKQITKLEKSRKHCESTQNNIKDINTKLQVSFTEYQAAKKEKENKLQQFNEIKDELKKFNSAVEQQLKSLLENLAVFSIKEPELKQSKKLLEMLEKRRDDWKKNADQKNVLEAEITKLKINFAHKDQNQKQAAELLAEEKSKLQEQQIQFDALVKDRKIKFADKNPKTVQENLRKALNDAKKAADNARVEQEAFNQKFNLKNGQLKAFNQNIEKLQPEVITLAQNFEIAFNKLNFTDEKEFSLALLSNEDKEAIEKQKKELETNKIGLQSTVNDRRKSLKKEENKKLSEKNTEEIDEIIKNIEKQLQELNKEIVEIRLSLDRNEQAIKEAQKKAEELEKQRLEYNKWESLNKLIGSHDGKKFCNFAQGLTFEVLVRLANEQLLQLSDRYMLIRDFESPLTLNIIDNYLAAEIRSTKNLSGGESFLVSLALALGLSKIASRKIRIDSLFLDEGFGTLDENALELALSTLANLREDGKLIGIISHVYALKERITRQIAVTPQSGGISKLEGSGVQMLN